MIVEDPARKHRSPAPSSASDTRCVRVFEGVPPARWAAKIQVTTNAVKITQGRL